MYNTCEDWGPTQFQNQDDPGTKDWYHKCLTLVNHHHMTSCGISDMSYQQDWGKSHRLRAPNVDFKLRLSGISSFANLMFLAPTPTPLSNTEEMGQQPFCTMLYETDKAGWKDNIYLALGGVNECVFWKANWSTGLHVHMGRGWDKTFTLLQLKHLAMLVCHFEAAFSPIAMKTFWNSLPFHKRP